MRNLPYDAVLFDLDGTLTRSEDGILASLRYALSKMNRLTLTDDELRKFIGPPLAESFASIAGLTPEQIQEAIRLYVAHYDAEGMYLYSVYPHIRRLLVTLKQNNVYVAVATSKPLHRAHALFSYFHMSQYFDFVVGEENNDAHIGKAELIRRALPKTYKRAVMVGDRRFDIEGAKANGIDAIGAGYGYPGIGELEEAGATCIVHSTEELLQLLCPGCKPPRGFFLSMEGMDGCGKTTQIEKLYQSLLAFGYDVLKTREPGGCPISESIRHLVLTTDHMEMSPACEALLYAAARAQHVHEVIRPAVQQGRLVLCDRFVDSSIAYQGAGRELGMKEVGAINAFAIREMMPDATIYLRMDQQSALQRRIDASTPDRLESQLPDFYERTRVAYDQLMAASPDRFIQADADQPIKPLANDILQAVLQRLDEAEAF